MLKFKIAEFSETDEKREPLMKLMVKCAKVRNLGDRRCTVVVQGPAERCAEPLDCSKQARYG